MKRQWAMRGEYLFSFLYIFRIKQNPAFFNKQEKNTTRRFLFCNYFYCFLSQPADDPGPTCVTARGRRRGVVAGAAPVTAVSALPASPWPPADTLLPRPLGVGRAPQQAAMLNNIR